MTSSGLDLRSIVGPTTVGARAQRWYWLPPVRWSFKDRSYRDALINLNATVRAALVGRRVHERVTTHPYPVEQWGKRLARSAIEPLPGWGLHVEAEQTALLQHNLAERATYIGVELLHHTVSRFATRRALEAADKERLWLDQVMVGQGVHAQPVTSTQLEWLLHRSVCLLAPAPITMPPGRDEWTGEDLHELTDTIVPSVEPMGRAVRMSAWVNGRRADYWVAVCTVGRITRLHIPGDMGPWIARSERLPFPVEWSGIYDVVPAEQVKKAMGSVLDRVRSMVDHYENDHGLEAPPKLRRQRKRALEIADEVGSPDPLQNRTWGWWRAAVAGGTEQEALARAQELKALYDPKVNILTAGPDQYRMYREFIPGAQVANRGHKRQFPVRLTAAALPTQTSVVGDRHGFWLGSTCGTAVRPVFWNPWRAQEVREDTGLTVIGAVPGGGKSTLGGTIVYHAVLSGVRATVLDPSGPLARLCLLPELAASARQVNLLDAQPGALSPYRVIAEPSPVSYPDPGEYARRVKLTAGRRRTLVKDVLRGLLPEYLHDDKATGVVLSQAVRLIPPTKDANPRWVIDALLAAADEPANPRADHARLVAEELSDIADLPATQMIFGPSGSEGQRHPPIHVTAWDGGDEWRLTVLTMPGLRLPNESTPRADWDAEETSGPVLLQLASTLTIEAIWGRARDERKLVFIDEVWALSGTPSGRSLINRGARDSRKHNLRLIIAGQNVDDGLSAGVANFVDSVFGGRTIELHAQEALLRIMDVPVGVGFERTLGGLSPSVDHVATHRPDRESDDGPDVSPRSDYREFVFADGNGGIEKIQVRRPPQLVEALDTTPNRAPAPVG